MNQMKIDRCLCLLREADDILMAENQLAIATHLSLVIELLAARSILAAGCGLVA